MYLWNMNSKTMYDIEWYQCANFWIIHSVLALAQQESNPSFLVVKIQQEKARHRSGALFSLRSSLPKNKDPYVFFCSAVGRPKSSDILWAEVLSEGSCFCRKFATSLVFPRLVKQKIYWRCLDVTPSGGILCTYGLPVTFPFLECPDLSEFAESPDESVAKIIFETSARQHFSVFWDAVIAEMIFNLEIVPGLSFQHGLAHLADECRS